MRVFELHRDEDVSGVSGTGIVAQGVELEDGFCVLRWLTKVRSTALYESAADLELIHGHDGKTRLVWLLTLERGEARPSNVIPFPRRPVAAYEPPQDQPDGTGRESSG